jgi:4-coumarate--CoA ligase
MLGPSQDADYEHHVSRNTTTSSPRSLKTRSGQSDGLPLKLILEHKKVIVLSDDPVLNEVAGFRTVESLVREGMKLPELSRKLIGGDQMAYLFQSSGTSGLPKAMMITHKNGCHSGMQTLITAVQAARYVGVEPLSPPARTLGVIPMYHSYGMILWILRVNMLRNTNIMLPKWDIEVALKSIEKYKIRDLPLVPPLVRQLAQSKLTEKYDLGSVIGAASGAAYLLPDVAYQLAKTLPQGSQVPVSSGYGLSEAASIASPAAPGIFGLEPALPGTIAYLLPGMEGRVVDPDTLEDVPKGEKGELWARGAVVTPGYYKDPETTADIFTEPEWLRTGDLIMRDEQDRIHYLDRLKEMIKVKGLQVAATEVEDTLLDHPERLVRDACVAGVDNGRGDGSLFVHAWVVLTDEGCSQAESVVANKLEKWVQWLSKHKWLTSGIEFVDSVRSSKLHAWTMLNFTCRYQEHHLARCCGTKCGINTMHA